MEIKVLQFEHPDYPQHEKYCCGCKDIRLFTSSNESFNKSIERIKEILCAYLKDDNFVRLQKLGWEVSENSAIPPIFTDEEVLEYVSNFFKVKIETYKFVYLNVCKIEPGINRGDIPC